MRAGSIVVLIASLALAALAAVPSFATFRGPNGLIAYEVPMGRHSQVFTIRPDGTGRRQLTRNRGFGSGQVDWSRDGRLVFTRAWNEDAPTEAFRVFTMDRDGRHVHAVTPAGVWADTPKWMPDGRIIYFDGKSNSLVVVNVDGSNLRNTGLPTGLPCVFPDGKRVAVLRDRNGDGSVRAIFMGRLFQPGVKRITPWEGIADKIDCSPDGTRVAFSTPSFDQGGSNVYVVRTDGTGLVQLTHDTDGTINNGIDSWSPDGKKIVFLSNRGGSYRLHTMNADGSDIAPLPNVQSGGHLAAWGTRH